jgi:hypothetical protein
MVWIQAAGIIERKMRIGKLYPNLGEKGVQSSSLRSSATGRPGRYD